MAPKWVPPIGRLRVGWPPRSRAPDVDRSQIALSGSQGTPSSAGAFAFMARLLSEYRSTGASLPRKDTRQWPYGNANRQIYSVQQRWSR
jgi:hypothetical protein